MSDYPLDHSYVLCDLRFPKHERSKFRVTRRNINTIDIESPIENIRLPYLGSENDLDGLVATSNFNLLFVLDTHAPLVSLSVTSRPTSQWYTDNRGVTKREVRRLERIYVYYKT